MASVKVRLRKKLPKLRHWAVQISKLWEERPILRILYLLVLLGSQYSPSRQCWIGMGIAIKEFVNELDRLMCHLTSSGVGDRSL